MNAPDFVLESALESQLARDGLVFLADFLTVAVTERPGNVDALAELGHTLSLLGRVEEGLTIDRQLVRLVPDNPEAHYNLACSLALTNTPEEALDVLEHAIDLGYTDLAHLERDDDLLSLRQRPRYAELVARLTARG